MFAVGAILSRKTEPGVTVAKVIVGRDTPALRFTPDGTGPHPVALLAHGVLCNKEFLFCYGEALAHAGFECYSVDQPGHGESPHPFSTGTLGPSLAEDARAIGPVDVFIGHSMGGYRGAIAEINDSFRPRLFIAIGSLAKLDDNAPPLLLISGELDEFIPASLVRARTDARVRLFPGCDHVSELYDRRLINFAVAEACITVDKTAPPASFCWRRRVAGLLLGWLGAIGLAVVVMRAPGWPARWVCFRAPVFSIVLIFGNAIVAQPWCGAMPHFQRLPWYLAGGILFWLLAASLRQLKIPRWSLLALAVVVTLIAGVTRFHAVMLLGAFFFFALLAGTVCGAIVARCGSPRDGDITLAIFAGYVIGQWIVKFW